MTRTDTPLVNNYHCQHLRFDLQLLVLYKYLTDIDIVSVHTSDEEK